MTQMSPMEPYEQDSNAVGDYRQQSRVFLSKAREYLVEEDLHQASEKGWGAAAQMFKAIAERRGWEHRGHRQIRRVASRLSDETGDADIRRLYRVASDLHTNFYEDLDTPADIAAGLEDVGVLLDKLEPLV